ncbi:MAG: tRNA (adenosine(37)-N6)-threonylcarbamoyltransferase complex dimerization subunit type 1 TsaB [Candidatus Dependentiae bacterium]|nr:tRNA (adenosine(37)-N6)-threonylcarbamoyltransferase complex dimerization subunit type 1 TsaB [Candidatus Dependentiae bacterium]
MLPYIILQYPYDKIEVALCDNGNIIQLAQEHKFNAIKSTIPHISSMLENHNLKLSDLKFIGVNVGPGPYNTLRALLTMANGIHFASKIPLIKLTALELLSLEHENENTLIIFQAFADNVFYQYKENTKTKTGACSINQLIEKLNKQSTVFLALGNGAQMYKEKLQKHAGNNVTFPSTIPLFNSIESMAKKSLDLFLQNKLETDYLKPIYFEDLSTK